MLINFKSISDKRLFRVITTGVCVWLMTICTSVAQDPMFSQFYSAPLQLNPALAGIVYAPNFSLNYRNQWPGINNAYQTYAVSYDQFFRKFNSGLGVYVQADNAGDGILQTYKMSLSYSYRLKINNTWEARLGVEAGALQTNLNWNKLVFLDQIDPEFGPVSPGGTPFPSSEVQPEELNRTDFDIGVGGVLYSDKYYFGISMKHLNTPGDDYLDINQNLTTGLPIRWNIHMGAEIPIRGGNNQKWSTFISPGVMFVKQASSWQLNGGTFVKVGQIYGGLWYRHANYNPDAVIGAVGFETGKFRITYSYDATISELSFDSGGSHEIGINIALEDKNAESPYNDCFSIFR